jgi:acyl-CoA synthetase (AMP-forming)/AMP-acid ligase II
MSEPGTLLSCLERAAASGEGVRFLDRSEETTVLYRDVLERARIVAGGLAAIGIEPGSPVAVAVPTGPSPRGRRRSRFRFRHGSDLAEASTMSFALP